MKKTFCGLPLLTLICMLTIGGAMPVQAGEINANEARLVSAASGTFTYEGKTYRACEEYVDELRSYLSGDDVDLTAEDVSSLISDMYANVGAGVQDGYLEEVQDSSDQTADASGEEQPDANEPTGEETVEDDASGEEDPWKKIADGETKTNKKDPADTPQQPAYTVTETPEETQIKDTEGSVIFSAAPMIKTVGYHTQTPRGLRVIGILMLSAICGGIVLVIRDEKA